MQPAVALHQVCKSFGPRQVLHSLSLSVAPGEIVGLLGPNGSGKTTTLRLMAGFYTPDSGRVTVCGRQPAPGRGNADIGYLPERAPLYDALTVMQYLQFGAGVKVAGGAGARRLAIERAIDGFDLQAVARSAIGRLSKGQRQRVGLAQAVLNDPPVLLLDEATNGLDPVQIVEARAMIRRCAQGGGVQQPPDARGGSLVHAHRHLAAGAAGGRRGAGAGAGRAAITAGLANGRPRRLARRAVGLRRDTRRGRYRTGCRAEQVAHQLGHGRRGRSFRRDVRPRAAHRVGARPGARGAVAA